MFKHDRMTEEMNARREEMMMRAEEGREELARRAHEIREQFEESMNAEAVTGFAGWTLISTGIAWGLTDWIRGRRSMNSLLFPIGLIALGTAVLGGGSVWHRRSAQISVAESRVRDELRALDPFARLRVLKDVGEETMPLIRRISGHHN
jgi:hypothetical protein